MEAFENILDRIASAGWVAQAGFIDDAMTRTLATESGVLYSSGAFHDAAIGSGARQRLAGEVRADQILWLDPADGSEAQRACLESFEQLRQRLNRDLQLGLFEFECHFARYAPGTFYRRHLDQFTRDSRRRVSSILYLNSEWRSADGGELRLYLGHGAGAEYVDIQPQGGTLVLFLSERFPHEVLPAQRERLSLTGWFKARA